MIQSGRKKRNTETHTTPENGMLTPSAKLTAILGVLVLTAFLVSAVSPIRDANPVIGDEVYQVFANADSKDDRPTSAEKDTSLWAYLESVIARLIYGDQ